MKHLTAIAGRELRSYFASPMAYAVLVVFSLLAGFFFVMQVVSFNAAITFYEQTRQLQVLERFNLNDVVIYGYYHVIWFVMLFLVPGLTMGLFSAEKANGTEELLLTSPLTIWELVLGKYLDVATMMTLLTAVVAAFAGILFAYGDPEPLQTAAGLLGIWLVGLTYAAIGAFTSSLTRSPLIAFLFAFMMLLLLWLLGFAADIGVASQAGGANAAALLENLRWISSDGHFDELARGLVDTRSLSYFAFMIAVFLLLTKTSVESVRWR